MREYKDSSALMNALNGLTNAKNQAINIKAQNTQEGINTASTIASLVETAANTALNIASLVVSKQLSDGNKMVDSSLSDLSSQLDMDILSGEERISYDPRTKYTEQIHSDGYNTLKNKYRSEIENNKSLSSSVKDEMLSTFDMKVKSLEKEALIKTTKSYWDDLNADTENRLNSSLKSDVQNYILGGGDISKCTSGAGVLFSRSDLTDNERTKLYATYLENVKKEGDVELASKIGIAEGSEKAYSFIEKSGYTGDEKSSLLSKVNKSITERKSALTSYADGVMRDALENDNLTSKEVYEEMEEYTRNMSPELKKASVDALSKAQREILEVRENNQMQMDKEGGLSSLYETKENIDSGALNDVYYNQDEMLSSLKNRYTSVIESEEKRISNELQTEVKATNDEIKSVLSDFDSKSKSIFTQFDNGDINGKETIDKLRDLKEGSLDKILLSGADEMNYGYMQIEANAESFISKIIDDYLPPGLKTTAESVCKALKTTVPDFKTDTDSYEEFVSQIMGVTADYFYETRGQITSEELKEYLNGSVIPKMLDFSTLKNSDKMFSETLNKNYETNMGKAVDAFNTLNSLSWDKNAEYLVFVKDSNSERSSGGNGLYVYQNENVKYNTENMASLLSTVVKDITGEKYEEIRRSSTLTLGDEGKAIASPQVRDSKGTYYRFGKNNTLEYKEKNKTWVDTKIKMQKSTEDTQKEWKKYIDKHTEGGSERKDSLKPTVFNLQNNIAGSGIPDNYIPQKEEDKKYDYYEYNVGDGRPERMVTK